jgi:hypothetical protein
MSRGIGRLQRAMLAAWEPAKWSGATYRGNSWGYINTVVARGREIDLGDHLYDARAVCRYVAREQGRLDHLGHPTPAFTAAFSRALRGLVRRGYLLPSRQPKDREQRLYTVSRRGRAAWPGF